VIYMPGDVLLFNRDGFYNRLIQVKTWSLVSHVEIVADASAGYPLMAASRNGEGVNLYELDSHGLYCVLRPVQPFSRATALTWMRSVQGQKYDWIGLLAFASAKFQGKDNGRMFCSEFACRFLRAGGVDAFNGADADAIAPSDFLKNSCFRKVGADARLGS
jgi:hypothetical protein